jgi:CHAT domain-containing protein/tetratricopeptide (TPR) repeat protein
MRKICVVLCGIVMLMILFSVSALASDELATYQSAYNEATKQFGEKDERSIDALFLLGLKTEKKDFAKGLSYIEKAYGLNLLVRGECSASTLRVLDSLGSAYHSVGNYEKALALRQKNYVLCKTVYGETADETFSAGEATIGEYIFMGNYADALHLEEYLYSVSKAAFGENNRWTVSSVEGLANLYTGFGRLSDALALQKILLEQRIKFAGENDWQSIEAREMMASTYLAMDKREEYLQSLCKVLELRKENFIKDSNEINRNQLISAKDDLATAYDITGQNEKALALRLTVLADRRNAFGEEDTQTIYAMSNVADSYRALNRLEEAVQLDTRCLSMLERTHDEKDPILMRYKATVASVYQQQAKHEAALEIYTSLYPQYCKVFGKENPETLNLAYDFAASLFRTGEKSKAGKLLKNNLEAIEKLRANKFLSPENRRALFMDWVEQYKVLSRIYLDEGNISEGMFTAEHAKSRSLLELMHESFNNVKGVLPEDETAKLESWDSQMSRQTQAIAESQGNPMLQLQLEAKRDALLQKIQEYRKELLQKYPQYAMFEQMNMDIIRSEEGKKWLPKDTLFIDYIWDKESKHAFVLDGTHPVTAFSIPWSKAMENLLADYHEIIAAKGLLDLEKRQVYPWLRKDGTLVLAHGSGANIVPPDKDAKLITTETGLKDWIKTTSLTLGKKLLEPALKDGHQYKQLLISPDNDLTSLPFELLSVDGQPVLSKYDVSYTPSLSVFVHLRKEILAPADLSDRKTLFIMGNPIYSPSLEKDEVDQTIIGQYGIDDMHAQGETGIKEMLQKTWNPIPSAEKEINTVKALFPMGEVDVFRGEQATEKTLRNLNDNGTLAKYKYLVFSTHGYCNWDNPALSALVLGSNNKGESNSFLTAAELSSYKLHSDLVFLSACETGLGKYYSGEGVMGLPFALYLAGNKNTVQTLWPVYDDSTAEFSKDFFSRLQKGESNISALNNSKRDFVKGAKYTAPVYWAPFVLYGI